MADKLLDYARFAPPAASNFGTLVGTNSENPTLSDAATRGLILDFGSSPAASHNVRGAFKAKGSGSSQSIIWRQMPTMGNYSFVQAGVALRESSSGKLLAVGYDGASGTAFVSRYTNPTTFSATQRTFGLAGQTGVEWFKITLVSDDPKKFFVSKNGTDWIEFWDESQTAFLTFNQVGPFVYHNDSSGNRPSAGTNRLSNAILYYSDPDISPGF